MPASHLKQYQFQPGQSGNPKGRPRGSVSVKTILKRKIDSLPPEQLVDFATVWGLDRRGSKS